MAKFRIDNSSNDGPYQGIHIFDGDTHVGTFWEDDAPLYDFNLAQRIRADWLVQIMNGEKADPAVIWSAFKHMKFIAPHERIKHDG